MSLNTMIWGVFMLAAYMWRHATVLMSKHSFRFLKSLYNNNSQLKHEHMTNWPYILNRFDYFL
jgi:hypothetical protein